MTSDAVSAGGDPRRLLADTRAFARRVRVAQRVTWLPLLVLGVVTFGAILVQAVSSTVTTGCRTTDAGEICKVWNPALESYWLVAMVAAYVVIAGGYLRVAQARGLGSRVRPYVIAGVAAAVVMFALIAAGAGRWIVPDPQDLLNPSTSILVLFRLLTASGGIGLALLVLAWLERNVALLLFALGYLAVVLVPINFGWGSHWSGTFEGAAQLIVNGLVLLLGGTGFALAQRLRAAR
jgi:hypothetical protein